MKIVKVRTGISIQPHRIEPITDEQIAEGMKNKTLAHVQGDIYEYTDKHYSSDTRGEYKTRDMVAEKPRKVVKKKATRKRKPKADEEE